MLTLVSATQLAGCDRLLRDQDQRMRVSCANRIGFENDLLDLKMSPPPHSLLLCPF